MNWDDLRFFLAVARTGTIRGAARELSVNHSTVSRRISSLQSTLATRLFEKLPDGYLLTESGESLYRSAERIESEARAAQRQVAGQDASLHGQLRVTLPDSVAMKLIMPDLAAFTRAYPQIEIELLVSYQIADLSRREADVALRFSADPAPDLVGRRLLALATAVYASPAYLYEAGWPEDPSQLVWIGWKEESGVPGWVRNSPFPHAPVRHRINHSISQLEAAKSGLGLTLLPCFLGDAEPLLRRASPNTLPGRELWLLTHEDLRRSARVQHFIRFMATALLHRRALIEGRLPQRYAPPPDS